MKNPTRCPTCGDKYGCWHYEAVLAAERGEIDEALSLLRFQDMLELACLRFITGLSQVMLDHDLI